MEKKKKKKKKRCKGLFPKRVILISHYRRGLTLARMDLPSSTPIEGPPFVDPGSFLCIPSALSVNY
jgi:hypothetical protein